MTEHMSDLLLIAVVAIALLAILVLVSDGLPCWLAGHHLGPDRWYEGMWVAVATCRCGQRRRIVTRRTFLTPGPGPVGRPRRPALRIVQ